MSSTDLASRQVGPSPTSDVRSSAASMPSIVSEDGGVDDEDLARMMTHVLENQKAVDLGEALAGRVNLLNSVTWLSRHVPVCVLDRLEHDITLMQEHDSSIEIMSSSASSEEDAHLSDLSDEEEEEEVQNSKEGNIPDIQELRISSLTEIKEEDEDEDEDGADEDKGDTGEQTLLGTGLTHIQEEEEEDYPSDEEPTNSNIKFNGEKEGQFLPETQPEQIEQKNVQETQKKDEREGQLLPETRPEQIKQKNDQETPLIPVPEKMLDADTAKVAHTVDKTPKIFLPERRSSGHSTHYTQGTLKLPHASRHESALLFVDISGFTKLSKLVSPERLSETINAYFQLIVDEVTSHGGDILKFAGDALFAEWQLKGEDESSRLTIEDCVSIAATCGAGVVSKCSDYPVYATSRHAAAMEIGNQVATLNVHCGLGVGKVVGVHVGDNDFRREYLILGDPIRQSTEAGDAATHGEFLSSVEAFAMLRKNCNLEESLASYEGDQPVLIAFKSAAKFRARNIPKMRRRHSVQALWEGWENDDLAQYRKLLSLYVHPVVVDNDTAIAKNPRRRNSSIQQRHTEEAELRSVYVMFISMPKVKAKITGNAKEDSKLFKLLNDIMRVCTRELIRYSGHLRQFIVDDKGLVLIATFGLRGSSFPNMVTERALPATSALHHSLQNDLGVYNRVGATMGNAYCGVVGGVKRHEYAVLGPSVNLAARLMMTATNPGILVDDMIRMRANKGFGFNALEPVKAKGFALPVPIYEPLTNIERRWGRVKSNFVGRKAEIKKLVGMAREMTAFNSAAKLALVSAESGTGKSTAVLQSVEHIRKFMSRKRKRTLIAKHVCKEGDKLVPFSMLKSLLPDVLGEVQAWSDDKSATTGSILSAMSGSDFTDAIDADWEGLSAASQASSNSMLSGLSGWSASPDRLLHLCREMDASPEFVELIGHHVLGLNKDALHTRDDKAKGKAPSLHSTINFMAQAFQMCTKRAELVIVALDDVHMMDEMSWKVLYKLFITTRNLFVVCSSRPLKDYNLEIEPSFWNELNDKYTEQGRFVHLHLSRFTKANIRSLLAVELGLDEEQISEKLQSDVFKQSGGMPHFANEIIESAKRRKAIELDKETDLYTWREDDGGSQTTFASIGELIIHRVDSFDANVRNVLNLAVVLGHHFDLFEIVAVVHQFLQVNNAQKHIHTERVCSALDFLVSERILIQVFEGGEVEDIEEGHTPVKDTVSNPFQFGKRVSNRSFSFCHDVWRASLLQMMLASRKRDVHRVIAMTLEREYGEGDRDYTTRVKLFSHWKESGDFVKSASLAMSLGKSFEELGLHQQSIGIYNDALDMWRGTEESEESIGGFSEQVLDSLGVTDLEYIIKVHIGLAKCLANLQRAAESVATYQNALKIYEAAPASYGFEDRTIVFPIFSGLFICLKFGQIEQDDECTYEQNLVKKFVNETRLNGDPVHYARSLAMQGEVHARLGNFEKALAAHKELERVYDVKKHSAGICKAYGSDRAGQSYSASALWHMELNNPEEAIRTCHYVINELMPHMEPRNVHNSGVLLYPVMWTMKDNGLALEARENWDKFVVQAFNEHFGEGAFTFALPVYKPLMMLLDLAGKEDEEVERFEEYLEFVLDEENLKFGKVFNHGMGNVSRVGDSITAEICYYVAKRLEDGDERKVTLVRNGLDVARGAAEISGKGMAVVAHTQSMQALKKLESLAEEMGLI